jgi:hypothetical protein
MRPEGRVPWLRVFGKSAGGYENVKKGGKVLVEGKLDISEQPDKERHKAMRFRILADAYRLL